MEIRKAFEKYQRYSIIVKSDGTIDYQSRHFRALMKDFKELGLIDLSQINKNTIIDIMELEKKHCSNNTINKRLKLLRQVLHYNDIYNIKIKLLKERKKTYERFSDSEIEAILKYINTLHDDIYNTTKKLVIRLLFDSGVRQSELLEIKRKNIDLINNRILLENTKTHNDRYIFFTKWSKIWIERVLESNTWSEYLFINDRTKTKYTYKHLRCLMDKIKKNTGIKRVHAHKFRHTLTTILIENNVSLPVVQKILGHKNISTTQRYAHLTKEKAKAIYDTVMF